jgi:hypothetical protein
MAQGYSREESFVVEAFRNFHFPRGENYGESKNKVPSEAVLHHLPQGQSFFGKTKSGIGFARSGERPAID